MLKRVSDTAHILPIKKRQKTLDALGIQCNPTQNNLIENQAALKKLSKKFDSFEDMIEFIDHLERDTKIQLFFSLKNTYFYGEKDIKVLHACFKPFLRQPNLEVWLNSYICPTSQDPLKDIFSDDL